MKWYDESFFTREGYLVTPECRLLESDMRRGMWVYAGLGLVVGFVLGGIVTTIASPSQKTPDQGG